MNSIIDVLVNTLNDIRKNELYKEYKQLDISNKKEIETELANNNVKRIIITIIFLFSIEIIYSSIHIFRFDSILTAFNYVSFLLMIIYVIYLIVINYILVNKKNKLIYYVNISFWVMFIIGFMLFIYLDLSNNDDMIRLFMMFVILSIVPILSLKEFMYLITLQVTLEFIIIINTHFEVSTLFYMIVISIGQIILSRTHYNMYLRLLIHEKKLLYRNETLMELASTDALTGLLNRRGMNDKISLLWPFCIRNGHSAAIIMIDIDYFKQYNDKFGHVEGDKCLQCIADIIKKTARRRTDVISRVGGEEFLIFVYKHTEDKALYLAKEIRKSIEKLAIETADREVSEYVTVSIGVATMTPNKDNKFLELYDLADKALYEAKNIGRNRIVINGKAYDEK